MKCEFPCEGGEIFVLIRGQIYVATKEAREEWTSVSQVTRSVGNRIL